MKREDLVPGDTYRLKSSNCFYDDQTRWRYGNRGEVFVFRGWAGRRAQDSIHTKYINSSASMHMCFQKDGANYWCGGGQGTAGPFEPIPLETLNPTASPREIAAMKLEKKVPEITKELAYLEKQLEALMNSYTGLSQTLTRVNTQIAAYKNYPSDDAFIAARIAELGTQATPAKIAEIASSLNS